jgi:hypothetical protein
MCSLLPLPTKNHAITQANAAIAALHPAPLHHMAAKEKTMSCGTSCRADEAVEYKIGFSKGLASPKK